MTNEIAPQFFSETPLYTVTFKTLFSGSRDVTFTQTDGWTDGRTDILIVATRGCEGARKMLT